MSATVNAGRDWLGGQIAAGKKRLMIVLREMSSVHFPDTTAQDLWLVLVE